MKSHTACRHNNLCVPNQVHEPIVIQVLCDKKWYTLLFAVMMVHRRSFPKIRLCAPWSKNNIPAMSLPSILVERVFYCKYIQIIEANRLIVVTELDTNLVGQPYFIAGDTQVS